MNEETNKEFWKRNNTAMPCMILLENDIFIAGSFIRGTLQCGLTSNESVKDIRVKITGKEHTEWTETTTNNDHPSTCEASNKFLESHVVLYTVGTLSAGWYDYNFSMRLPEVIPSSYEGTYGYVRYSIAGIINRPPKPKYKSRRELTIITLVNLNGIPPYLHEPSSNYEEDTLCSMCCNYGLITLQMVLQKRAFVIGETVNVKLTIVNYSKTNPRSFRLELVEVIKAHSPKSPVKYKKETKILSKTGCLLNCSLKGVNTFCLPLQLPQNLKIFSFIGSKLWNVEYIIRATCNLLNRPKNLQVDINPIIGHIQMNHKVDDAKNSEGLLLKPIRRATLPKIHEEVK